MKDRTDIVALLDEFAGRFYDELDYNQECLNGCVRGRHRHVGSVGGLRFPS